jgi:hypothetical protein
MPAERPPDDAPADKKPAMTPSTTPSKHQVFPTSSGQAAHDADHGYNPPPHQMTPTPSLKLKKPARIGCYWRWLVMFYGPGTAATSPYDYVLAAFIYGRCKSTLMSSIFCSWISPLLCDIAPASGPSLLPLSGQAQREGLSCIA